MAGSHGFMYQVLPDIVDRYRHNKYAVCGSSIIIVGVTIITLTLPMFKSRSDVGTREPFTVRVELSTCSYFFSRRMIVRQQVFLSPYHASVSGNRTTPPSYDHYCSGIIHLTVSRNVCLALIRPSISFSREAGQYHVGTASPVSHLLFSPSTFTRCRE